MMQLGGNKLWKDIFMNLIRKIQEKNPLLVLIDLKECTEFSEKPEYYNDLTHFNYYGACRFTEYLAEKLCSEFGLKI